MMSWFNRKPVVKENLLFSKNIEYKGFKILIWVKKSGVDYHIRIGEYEFNIKFDTGWSVANDSFNYGIYNTYISADSLQNNLDGHLVEAKKYIDAKIKEPDNIKAALNIVNNLK